MADMICDLSILIYRLMMACSAPLACNQMRPALLRIDCILVSGNIKKRLLDNRHLENKSYKTKQSWIELSFPRLKASPERLRNNRDTKAYSVPKPHSSIYPDTVGACQGTPVPVPAHELATSSGPFPPSLARGV